MTLAAALSTGCEPATAPLETLLCRQVDVAVFHVEEKADCWVVAVDQPGCIVTARDVDACSVPDRSDELFAGGDDVTLWCDWPSGVDATARFAPVDCISGARL